MTISSWHHHQWDNTESSLRELISKAAPISCLTVSTCNFPNNMDSFALFSSRKVHLVIFMKIATSLVHHVSEFCFTLCSLLGVCTHICYHDPPSFHNHLLWLSEFFLMLQPFLQSWAFYSCNPIGGCNPYICDLIFFHHNYFGCRNLLHCHDMLGFHDILKQHFIVARCMVVTAHMKIFLVMIFSPSHSAPNIGLIMLLYID